MACSCQKNAANIGRTKTMSKKRRRPSVRGFNTKDMTSVATSAALGGAGAHVLGMLLEKFLPAEYAQYSHYVKLAGGVILVSMSKNTMVRAAGLGAATVGAAAIVSDLTDGVNSSASSVNLLPPGGGYDPSVYPGGGNTGISPL